MLKKKIILKNLSHWVRIGLRTKNMSSFGTVTVYTDKFPENLNENTQIIGTHNGKFHCDEVLATSILTLISPFQDAVIVRSRDPTIWNKCNVLVDVGAVYDPKLHRYDHHQISFQDNFGLGFVTRLSSAGLIYKHFGREILQKACQVEEKHLDYVYKQIYQNFFEHIDAIDNGINVSDGELKYQVTTTLSSRVGYFNPNWNTPEDEIDESKSFAAAMALTRAEFMQKVDHLTKVVLPARTLVEDAIKNRFSIHKSGHVIHLTTVCPWQSHIYDLEKEMDIVGEILYVVYKDTRGKFRIQCISESSGSFINRQSLPKAWWGIRDEALDKLTGVPGSIFVHASGFIGGHNTYEGVLSMADQSISNMKDE